MRRFFLLPLIVAFLSTIGLTGCGVTKLWGDEPTFEQDAARQGPGMREQADAIADPVWEIEEKRSMMNQMASIFVSGARSAGEALDVFDWTGKESPETRQAKKYLEQISQRENYGTFASAVMSDIQGKNQASAAFRNSGIEALDRYHKELADIGKGPENGNRKNRIKRLFSNSDEDRRAAIQASKSLRQQASVFAATVEVLKTFEETPDMTPLEEGVEQLLFEARELRALADDLDLD